MLSFKQWKEQFYWKSRKVNKMLTLLGGLLGLAAATVILYFFAISNEVYPHLIIFALLPWLGIIWFSIFDKGETNNSSETYWNVGKEERKSKFDKPMPSLDGFGFVVGLVFSYFSIYLSEVLALAHAQQQTDSKADLLPLFVDSFVNLLKVDRANYYVWYYWIGLTIVLFIALGGTALVTYIYSKTHLIPGRKLTDTEKAKLAYGAVLFTRNGLSYDYLLGYLPTGRISVKDAKEMLAVDWDIHNKQNVLQTVTDLLADNFINGLDQLLKDIRSGEANIDDQAVYDDIVHNLIAHYQYTDVELGKIQTLKAWNYDRLVNLLRYAYVAEYISEQEMWTAIDQAIVGAKRHYHNWRQYFAAVLLGRSLGWGGDFESNRIVAMKLLNNPNSIYKQYPF
ncbi:hypothetical protein C1M49_03390 [Streptococcus intermedius]|uniref:DUF1266 domain-containing protein n=1 Tax=Streptococcus intermedius TaxID=1338 RepID=UPI000C85215F|nr:DUF1266 domain-containing protein [Streptococcus intermedius]PMR93113.1 hypothetical protein C1M49_03390 [Streptococcus intermedius]